MIVSLRLAAGGGGRREKGARIRWSQAERRWTGDHDSGSRAGPWVPCRPSRSEQAASSAGNQRAHARVSPARRVAVRPARVAQAGRKRAGNPAHREEVSRPAEPAREARCPRVGETRNRGLPFSRQPPAASREPPAASRSSSESDTRAAAGRVAGAAGVRARGSPARSPSRRSPGSTRRRFRCRC
jgi:hypothetical protein